MKIVVQNKENRLFWKNDSIWIANPHEAHDFETTTQAKRFCLERQWRNMQIIIKFERIPDLVFQVA